MTEGTLLQGQYFKKKIFTSGNEVLRKDVFKLKTVVLGFFGVNLANSQNQKIVDPSALSSTDCA